MPESAPAATYLNDAKAAIAYISGRANDAFDFMLEGISTHAYAKVERVNCGWQVRERGGRVLRCASPSCGVAYILARYW